MGGKQTKIANVVFDELVRNFIFECFNEAVDTDGYIVEAGSINQEGNIMSLKAFY